MADNLGNTLGDVMSLQANPRLGISEHEEFLRALSSRHNNGTPCSYYEYLEGNHQVDGGELR
jgi:hypothetical protein